MKRAFLFFTLALWWGIAVQAQDFSVTGQVKDADTGGGLPGVSVGALGAETLSGDDGFFELKIPEAGEAFILRFFKTGYSLLELTVLTNGRREISVGEVSLAHPVTNVREIVTDEDRIPIITLSADDEESELAGQNISGILSATQDPFINAASFNLGTGGFDIRGFGTETVVLFNGMPFNSLENDAVFWSAWGGLNDVTRNRESRFGLEPLSFSFGGIGGGIAFDTRASEQRKQKRLSYMVSNRTYTGRVMGTWSTGMLPSGWAFSFSGSKRWAQEGYVPGTFYDSYSYFASIDRRIGRRHLLNLTALGTPTRRGSSGAAIQELNDLAGTNFYNPNWGWQNGEKRNARVVDAHQPIVVLRHDWKAGDNASLTTAAGLQIGRYGRTNLDWFNAPDPRADFYRKTPLYFSTLNAELGRKVADTYRNDPDLLQLQWHDLYAANEIVNLGDKDYFNLRRFFADGTNPAGFMSQYILDEQRSDVKKLNASTTYQNNVSDVFTIQGGLTWQYESTHYFRKIHDLMGGDYFMNVDRFALSNPQLLNKLFDPRYHDRPEDAASFDLESDRLDVREGDTYGWDYDITGQQLGTWIQGQFSFRKLEFFLAAQTVTKSFWRTGHMRNGRFPESSFGDSEKQLYQNYGAKGGMTYKLNGRNFFYANAAILDRAPDPRIAYAAPRSRDQLVPGLVNEKVMAGEAGFHHRSPGLRARATIYYAQVHDGLKLTRFFVDEIEQFGSYILTDLDRRHVGAELGFQAKINSKLSLTGAAALGQYVYTSRPQGFLVADNDGVINERGTIYMKNTFVPNTPQTAISTGLEYRSPKFWSASITVNYFDHNYIDISPERRTAEAAFGEQPGSDSFRALVGQEKLPNAFTVDLFANKSFKINRDMFFYLTAGVTNLLNTTLIQGGYEQLRYDKETVVETGIDVFAPRYFYAFGTNFFVLGALRF